ncbi:MAG: prepilin-type N-terminal cleavage/methylation domain-containing protein [Elusimicrobia bacterium]|nr:prepilin-type N-terminal cleavage/methylation domain-containing protein [Elusimicrobiota bacterium]
MGRTARSFLSGRGFTLVELMIVVALIGILSAIAIPKFSDLVMKSQEGATKGNLGRLRSALNIYYSDMEGYFPNSGLNYNSNSSTVLSSTLVPKYINTISTVKIRNHAPLNRVYMHSASDGHSHDAGYGHWAYDGRNPTAATWGKIWVMCSHTDAKGERWSNY